MQSGLAAVATSDLLLRALRHEHPRRSGDAPFADAKKAIRENHTAAGLLHIDVRFNPVSFPRNSREIRR